MLALFKNPADKVTLVSMFDQSFRSASPSRTISQIYFLLRKHGIPSFFSPLETFLLYVFLLVGDKFSVFSLQKFKKKIQQETDNLILLGKSAQLQRYCQNRMQQGFQINLNLLGELVLGEKEAQNHLQQYLQMLQNPSVNCISVKISSIYSQLFPLADEQAEKVLVTRMSRLYKAAMENNSLLAEGERIPKFVNLDMEEYRDVELTLRVFTRTLDLPEFQKLKAGIVLQAYLPDAFLHQKKLTHWAQKRTQGGGSAIKLRIVKGANLQMEKVESASRGWELPVYESKLEVDANYKRMLEYALVPEHAASVHIGIASHNLFELAYAWNLAKTHKVERFVIFEMLEGIANPVKRALLQNKIPCLIYTPIARENQFLHAIAYLIRRMDENTSGENFMRHSFGLKIATPSWNHLKAQFINSWKIKDHVSSVRKRQQNRTKRISAVPRFFPTLTFQNEPDTDWFLAENQSWAQQICNTWMKRPQDPTIHLKLKIAGKIVERERKIQLFYDRCQQEKVIPYSTELANQEDVQAIITEAVSDPVAWRKQTSCQRHQVLSQVANELRKNRGDLIGIMACVTGKTFPEGDIEVSEAIDFVEYYPFSLRRLERDFPNMRFQSKGVGLVITPWNFPLAIPCGGITASLAAGNTTLLKPAPEAIPVAYALAECFWQGGVPENVLQVIPCEEGDILGELVSSPEIDFIIFTGSTETAFSILTSAPQRSLYGETGGKNSTMVSALSDRDQAVQNIVRSAFSNAGQKCSATSLLVLEKEVYEDPLFKQQLSDCTQSYLCGSVWDFSTQVGPLIHPPHDKLKKAFEELNEGESWLIPPKRLQENPYLWAPCIKWGVKRGSYCHQTELFGPLLSVMVAQDLEEGIEIVNETGYGLTSGLQSLDPREHQLWKDKVNAGNLYINSGTTGAIVQRQPFGGMRLSAFGPGLKAGGPNYLISFVSMEEVDVPQIKDGLRQDSSFQKLLTALKDSLLPKLKEMRDVSQEARNAILNAMESYGYQMEFEFSRIRDPVKIYGQDNFLRYLSVKNLAIRIHPADSVFEILAMVLASIFAGCFARVSVESQVDPLKYRLLENNSLMRNQTECVIEGEKHFLSGLKKVERIRSAHPERVSLSVYRAASSSGIYIADPPPLQEGRFELLHYLQEQSISSNYHRYGNPGEREPLH